MEWTATEIRALRRRLGDNAAAFGARVLRSGRTVEKWEQGTRTPDPLVRRLLDELREKAQNSNDLAAPEKG